MRWILLLAVGPMLAAGRDALLIRFGTDGVPDVDWSGSISPAPLRLSTWQFDEGDSLSGNGWKCRTKRETYWDTPYERSMKGTSRLDKVTVKGIVIEYDPASTNEFTIRTAQGEFRVGAQRSSQTYLNGRATAMPAAFVESLTQGRDADDHPSLLTAKDGTLWLAWISYEASGDQIYVRRWSNGAWSAAEAITPGSGDFFRTALAQDRDGRVWVIWSGQSSGDFDLCARAWDGKRWLSEQRITTAPGSDTYHSAATDRAGNVHLAWMSARNGNFDIYTKHWDGRKWSSESRVSPSDANDWEPALAAGPDGSVTILWDTYDKSSYDVVMRSSRAGRIGPLTTVASSGAFEARPSAQYDATGGLWIAWEEGDWNWGKDYGQGIVESGRGLLVRRQTRVAYWKNGVMQQPLGAVTDALPEELRQTALAPRLLLDASGTPWVFFRYRVNAPVATSSRGARTMWRQGGTYYAGSRWVPMIELPGGFGRIDAPAAAALARDRSLRLAWATDGRQWPLAATLDQDLVEASFSSAPAQDLKLQAFAASTENLSSSHAAEEEDLRRVRSYRVKTGGKEYRIVRGDIHRHTDISWDGNRDGSLHDAYRYALDAVGFEFMGVCDHQAGNMIPYNWWMIQKAVDLFSLAGRFAPLYSYERSLSYPNGHRNVLFAERGRPVLAIGAAEQKGIEGAGKLYAYLKQFQGLTTSHTSATGAGTDWRDSSEDLEPVVEIYQGYRRNYEGPGTPRAPAQGEEPSRFAPGYVWNAWAKGIKLGVQSSSDHVSTHISYAAFYVDSNALRSANEARRSILDAVRARRTYAATDNIVVDFRIGEHFMGSSFTGSGPQTVTAYVAGTGPMDQVQVVKNNKIVYTAPGSGSEVRFTYTDREARDGTAWYYIRAEQKDGQLAWSSPIWVNSR